MAAQRAAEIAAAVLWCAAVLTCAGAGSSGGGEGGAWAPCSELNDDLRYPCRCQVQVERLTLSILMDCDRVVFAGDFPPLPYGAPVVSFRQRHAGHQALPTQFRSARREHLQDRKMLASCRHIAHYTTIFGSSALPLRSLDFSHNSVRRLPERLLARVRGNLTSLRLADNLLGDTLNPIFSTSELHGLPRLELLDLSGNAIRALEEGLLIGCDVLKVFLLDRNKLQGVPVASLNGPQALRTLSLRENVITTIRQASFASQKSLEEIDLHGNMISTIEGGAFASLARLLSLDLGRNRLSKLNSDVFYGAEGLETLDLSENFISEFPTVAMKAFATLKQLNLSSNMITSIENSHLGALVSLQALDLSRNNLVRLAPGTFVGLTELSYLDVGVNSLRTVEDDAFDGLTSLKTLLLRDNNILLIPATALSRLPNLVSVHLGFNRVTALSNDILRSVSDRITSLVLSRNVIRELPPAAFNHFKTLHHLDLSGNLLNSISADVFSGLETTLEFLSLAQNRILGFTGQQLQFLNLWLLDLSSNQLSEIPSNAFDLLPNLSHLNMSRNYHIGILPQNLLHHSSELTTIDLSYIGLKSIPVNLFAKSLNIEQIFLGDNAIQEIAEGTFKNLKNLTHLDLSYNNIANIKTPAFVNVMSIKHMSLKGNQMNAFKGEFFNTGTGLEFLDLSENQLSYLFPSSFKIHPRLKEIILSDNKFNFFPSELISTLQYLELVDISGNVLKSVEELDFARLPKLRVVKLANNELESISEMAFHNSTQLQVLELSNNKIDRLGDRTFEGLIRLEILNLGGNLLTELPDAIFDRTRLQMLEKINLSNNLFETAPLKALQKQYFFVSSVDLSHNEIVDIPADDSVMVNIKKLDLSFNPLSDKSIANVLSEPKTVRELNLAGTGMTSLGQLETPFLHHLNLSYNNITNISPKTFTRTTLLESLDISNNRIGDISSTLENSWPNLKNLQTLNLSSNPITAIIEKNFDGLSALRTLDIKNLDQCTRIEKNVFRSLANLAELRAHGFPRLGYLDVQGILQHLLTLERLDIEIKDTTVGADQLHSALHPRLEELGVRGERLKSISSGALAGLKAPAIAIRLRNTSVTTLPPALLFSLPRSSRVTLDVSGGRLTSLQPQLLVALDDRRADLSMLGLETNPIRCDCNARALRRWLPGAGVGDVRCASPDHLAGYSLVEIGDDELSCDARRRATAAASAPTGTAATSPPPRLLHRTSAEPDIIWSVAPSPADKPKVAEPKGAPVIGISSPSNDDNLIIGIVGGVVAFIAILIIAICIVRLKMTTSSDRGGGGAGGMGGGVPWPGPWGGAWGPPGPGYAATLPPGSMSTATLPHKLQSAPPSVRYLAPSQLGPPPPAPYFISLPPHDDKIYR